MFYKKEDAHIAKILSWASLFERNILQLVSSGKKLGCYTSGKLVPTRASKLNLECVLAPFAVGDKVPEQPCRGYAVARRVFMREVLPSLVLPVLRIRVIKRRLRTLIGKVRDKSVAQTLAFLLSYPRVDKVYGVVTAGNLERPEVAILQGLLLGYAPCCIEYYIETRYLRSAEPIVLKTVVSDEVRLAKRLRNHVRCPECVKVLKNASYRRQS